MSSRFLDRLSALVSVSSDVYDKACLNLESASYLARRGDHLDSLKIVQSIRSDGLHLHSSKLSAWLNFAEGMQFHCKGRDPEARVKWSRCVAIARSSRSDEVLARALAWLAFCDYTILRIDSIATLTIEAMHVLAKDNYEGCARINMTLAQIYHLCGSYTRAREFYDRSRLACLESGDDVMLAALIHNMAWLRMSALRNESLRGMHLNDDSKIVELASESTRNYESLIGSRAFDAMTPLLAAQVDIMQARYADAILKINTRIVDLPSQGLRRLSASLVADRAYCRAILGDNNGSRADAVVAIESVSSEDHVDDLAVLYTRIAEVYRIIDEAEKSAFYKGKADALWMEFDLLKSRLLSVISCIHIQDN